MKVCPRCDLKYPDENDRCFVDGEALVHAPDPHIGTVVDGKYLIESKLGEGGMAIVYRARHTLVDRPVALKILNPQMAKNPALKERFRREAKNTAAVSHPNIVEILDNGETADGSAYLVMELLDGATLDAHIEAGPIPAPRAAALGLQIAQGLARAHDFDVIHRDLKPENIFVATLPGDRFQVKLLDFGIARSLHDSRLTTQGDIFGTPQYMAPERVSTIDAGLEADLYALGVILFEMVTGRLPFDANDIPSFFIAHMQEIPPRPSQIVASCPRRLEELILQLLEKDPERRPVDAHQVIKELAAIAPTDGPDGFVAPQPSSSGRPVAPTLPPTTLAMWTERVQVFDKMLGRAYPAGAPSALASSLQEIRAIIDRVHQLRGAGLGDQRVLESMQDEARENRARLGNAVQTLAEDLSNARGVARQAGDEVAPYLKAEESTRAEYEAAHQGLEGVRGFVKHDEPKQEVVAALRLTATTLERWMLARGSGEKARTWLEAKAAAVRDLAFQIEALRANLTRTEAAYAEKRSQTESALRQRGQEVGELEQRLIQIAGGLVEPLRQDPGLADLFVQLERAG
ncbi:MAG: protein kinase [Deltaproteobacteria bacterium]|nr:protein kinase [Deltaproteobacteria bacterium]